jgi:molecular chaperone HtpG
VDDPDLDLPEEEGDEEEAQTSDLEPETFGKLIVRFQHVLGDRVKEVREAKVLKDSPCRLVSSEAGPEREMERVRRLLEEDYKASARILELNRGHSLIQNLGRLIESQANDALVDLTIEQLFENMLLLEGLHPNPIKMVPRIQSLLEKATTVSSGPAQAE